MLPHIRSHKQHTRKDICIATANVDCCVPVSGPCAAALADALVALAAPPCAPGAAWSSSSAMSPPLWLQHQLVALGGARWRQVVLETQSMLVHAAGHACT